MADDDPYRGAPGAPAALVALAAGAEAKRRELPRDVATLGSRARRVQRALGVRTAVGLASTLGAVFGLVMLVDGALSGAAVIAAAGLLLIPGGIAIDVALYRGAKADTAARLARGERQPFPVQGYALWLASERPLFDVHLRGAVARAVVVDAVAALDVDTAVEWLDDRLFRVAIPPRAIGVADEPMNGGDEQRWLAFADKILGPLHQDVGIERVEMGGSMRALASAAT